MIRSYRFGLAVAAAALVTASLNAGPASTPYRKLALPSLSGDGLGAAALGINDRGQVVGSSVAGRRTDEEGGEEDVVHAVLWDKGVITDLGTLAGEGSSATAINNAGQIVGFSDGHAVMWDRGAIVDLGTLPPDVSDGTGFSYAKAINNRGQVVGEGSAAGNSQCNRAILWDRGTIVDLGTLRGSACEWPDYYSSTAVAINDRGQISGTSVGLDGMPHAVIWDGGRIFDLGLTQAAGINNRGEVVVGMFYKITAGHASPTAYPFTWRHDRATVLEMPLELGWTWPVAINDRGQVVGYQYVYVNGTWAGIRPLLWEGGTLSTALGTRGLPMAINARGDIVGYGSDGGGRPRDQSAYVWTR